MVSLRKITARIICARAVKSWVARLAQADPSACIWGISNKFRPILSPTPPRMALGGVGLNIGLNLLLIPQMQALGSAWASLATQLFTALAQIILAVIFLKLTINYLVLARLVLFVCFVFLAGMFSREIETWYLGYFIMITSSILFAFIIKLINLKAMAEII